MTHIGIEIRIRLAGLPGPNGVLLHANSDQLYLNAKYGSIGDVDTNGWTDLLPAIVDASGRPSMVIEIRAVHLPDDYPSGDTTACGLYHPRVGRCARLAGHPGQHRAEW